MRTNNLCVLITLLLSCQTPFSWQGSERELRIGYVKNEFWVIDRQWEDLNVIDLKSTDESFFQARTQLSDSVNYIRMFQPTGELFLSYLDTLAEFQVYPYLYELRNDTMFFDNGKYPFQREIWNTNKSKILFYQFEKCLFEMEICNDGWIIYYLMEGTDTALFNEAKKSIEIIETPLK